MACVLDGAGRVRSRTVGLHLARRNGGCQYGARSHEFPIAVSARRRGQEKNRFGAINRDVRSLGVGAYSLVVFGTVASSSASITTSTGACSFNFTFWPSSVSRVLSMRISR